MRQERGEERNKASSAVLLSALQPGVRAEAHAKGPVLQAVLIPPGAWSLEPGVEPGAQDIVLALWFLLESAFIPQGTTHW